MWKVTIPGGKLLVQSSNSQMSADTCLQCQIISTHMLSDSVDHIHKIMQSKVDLEFESSGTPICVVDGLRGNIVVRKP